MVPCAEHRILLPDGISLGEDVGGVSRRCRFVALPVVSCPGPWRLMLDVSLVCVLVDNTIHSSTFVHFFEFGVGGVESQ